MWENRRIILIFLNIKISCLTEGKKSLLSWRFRICRLKKQATVMVSQDDVRTITVCLMQWTNVLLASSCPHYDRPVLIKTLLNLILLHGLGDFTWSKRLPSYYKTRGDALSKMCLVTVGFCGCIVKVCSRHAIWYWGVRCSRGGGGGGEGGEMHCKWRAFDAGLLGLYIWSWLFKDFHEG
jgi:hypothetical protein